MMVACTTRASTCLQGMTSAAYYRNSKDDGYFVITLYSVLHHRFSCSFV